MDILHAANELIEYTAGTDEAGFLANKFEQSFVFHRLVIIGEAAKGISSGIQTRYPEVPWARIVALRNRLVHAYFDMDLPLVWSIVATQLADLRQRTAEIIRSEFPDAVFEEGKRDEGPDKLST